MRKKLVLFLDLAWSQIQCCAFLSSMLTKSVYTGSRVHTLFHYVETPLVLRIWDFCFVNVSHSVCVSSAHDTGVGLDFNVLREFSWVTLFTSWVDPIFHRHKSHIWRYTNYRDMQHVVTLFSCMNKKAFMS